MKLYTIYNDDGFFWGEYHIEKPINATERIYTGSYIKPKYSVQDDNFYESATIEEIEEANKPFAPLEVALWKLKFILSQMGLEQSVIDSINQLPDPPKTAALYLWNYGTAVDRHSATVDLIKQSVGLSDRQVDDIFIQAESIKL